MHNALPATLGRATRQGEKPPLCLQPGPASAGQVLGSLKAGEELRASRMGLLLEGGMGRNGTVGCSHGQAEGRGGQAAWAKVRKLHSQRSPVARPKERGQGCVGTKPSSSPKMQVAVVQSHTA